MIFQKRIKNNLSECDKKVIYEALFRSKEIQVVYSQCVSRSPGDGIEAILYEYYKCIRTLNYPDFNKKKLLNMIKFISESEKILISKIKIEGYHFNTNELSCCVIDTYNLISKLIYTNSLGSIKSKKKVRFI